MIYGSVCSGIEAATVAWHPLGWRPAWFAEINPYCKALLKHHYPGVRNFGDFTTIRRGWLERIRATPIDLLVGGTPCQDFSIAGLRDGLDGARGNLTLEYLKLARRLRPRWLVWENVPGVLSIDEGRAFGAILGGLVELGYGFAYRILDAQYFGVPQRRRRVFIVGYLGGWRPAAAVLFERESMSGYPPPSRKAGQGSTRGVAIGSTGGGFTDTACTLDDPSETFIPVAIPILEVGARTGRSTEDVSCGAGIGEDGDPMFTLQAGKQHGVTVALRGRDGGATAELGGDIATALRASSGGGDKGHVLTRSAVRRLTPRECERLQGFPDDYTLVPYHGKPAVDGPRYKALGNSMATPVMGWIGQRIEHVDTLLRT